jgi:hypothetical protein
VEIKGNYPTDKKNTPNDSSKTFLNIEYFVQVGHLEKIMKNLIFPIFRSKKTAGGRKIFKMGLIKHSIYTKLPCQNFRKIRPPRASEFELKHRRQNLLDRQE